MGSAIAAVATLVILVASGQPTRYGPYIVASGLMPIVYNVTLVRSYRRNDLAQAYPSVLLVAPARHRSLAAWSRSRRMAS